MRPVYISDRQRQKNSPKQSGPTVILVTYFYLSYIWPREKNSSIQVDSKQPLSLSAPAQHSFAEKMYWYGASPTLGTDELLILDRWACSSWEKCKRLLQPLVFRCSDRRGATFWFSSKQVTCTWPPLRKCERTNAFTWCRCSWSKVAMRRGASEYSAVYPSNYLGLAWPSALAGGMPKRRTLYFKQCACLLANQAYEDPESHRLWRQGGDVLEPREYGLPNMGVSGRFL